MDSALLCIALPDGRWLGLSPAAFAEALQAGQALNSPPIVAASPHSSELCTAQQLAAQLGVPATWVEQQARLEAIPVVRLGKYVRFDAAAVLAALQRTDDLRTTSARCPANPLKPLRKKLGLQNGNARLNRPGTGAKEVR